MSGPQRNPDKLNSIGVVVVGICGAVLVYVTIVALQAFYMGDTSEVQTMADYGGQDTVARNIRAQQTGTIMAPSNPNPAPKTAAEIQTYRIPLKHAIKSVVADAKRDASSLVPIYGKSDKPTVLAVYGRPKALPTAPAPTDGAGSAAPAPGGGPAAPATGAGAGSSADSVPRTPTGGMAQGGGAPPGGTTATPAKTPGATNNSTNKAPATGSAAKGDVR